MKALFCAPTNFFDLASLRQAVRLACFAASSLGALAVPAGGGDEAGGAKAATKFAANEKSTRQAETAGSKERMV